MIVVFKINFISFVEDVLTQHSKIGSKNLAILLEACNSKYDFKKDFCTTSGTFKYLTCQVKVFVSLIIFTAIS